MSNRGKQIGYKRVSTYEQNLESQLMNLTLDKVFSDVESGFSTKNRLELANLKDYVREDDIVYVECMDRLGRNADDLDDIVKFLLAKNVQIQFVREGIVLGKKDDLMSEFSYHVLKCCIHFLSRLAKERQRIGIENARRAGKYQGRKQKLDSFQIEHLKHLLRTTRYPKAKIAKQLGISRQTLYRYLKKIEPEVSKAGFD